MIEVAVLQHVLLYVDGEDAVTYAEAAHVAMLMDDDLDGER